ncbi:MAG: DUF3987 domain-containing protein [Bacteroidota bacterium]
MADPLSQAPGYPDDVYTSLPTLLARGAGHFAQRTERDVWLTGAVSVLSACLPRVGFWNADGFYRPHLMACVVAPASSGKGVLRYAHALGTQVERLLRTEYGRELADWEDHKAFLSKGQTAPPKPPMRKLYVSANASAAAFFDAIGASDDLPGGGGHNLVFETEIDTLAASQAQEWGDFSDVLRKAFHHERHSVERKERELVVERLELAMCISGTPEQFLRLFGTAENGLFSRFGFYIFSGTRAWRDQRPTDHSRDRYGYFADAARAVRELFLGLRTRERRLEVVLSDAQWDLHTATFRAMLDSVVEAGRAPETDATVKRAGIMAVRIAAVLATLRASERGDDLYRLPCIQTADEDVRCGLLMARTWTQHAAMLLTHMPGPERVVMRARDLRQDAFFDALPEEFTGAEAVLIGADMEHSRRSVYNYLKTLLEDSRLANPSRGLYTKTRLEG